MFGFREPHSVRTSPENRRIMVARKVLLEELGNRWEQVSGVHAYRRRVAHTPAPSSITPPQLSFLEAGREKVTRAQTGATRARARKPAVTHRVGKGFAWPAATRERAAVAKSRLFGAGRVQVGRVDGARKESGARQRHSSCRTGERIIG